MYIERIKLCYKLFYFCYNGVLLSIIFLSVKSNSKLSPFVLIPGDGGSQLEASLNKSSAVHYICQKTTSEFYNLWLNLELLVPLVIDCFIDNMKLSYDKQTHKTSNTPGVTTRVPGFGNTTTIEYLDPSQISLSKYFNSIVETLIAFNYVRGFQLHGAPFDFRKAPNEHQEFFENLKNLIEDTYQKNLNSRVTLLSHSMGSAFVLYFLNHMDTSWKNTYIQAFVSLSGCFAGSVKALKVYLAGVYILNAHALRMQQITSPTLSFLMPSAKFWAPGEVLVANEYFNYTVQDYEQFFKDLDFETGWEMRKDTYHLIEELKSPEVEVHCLHGFGMPTIERIEYPTGTWLKKDPKFVFGDGDGTVNLRSLKACLSWKNNQKQSVFYQTFEGVDHMSILHHPPVLEYIQNLVENFNKKNNELSRVDKYL